MYAILIRLKKAASAASVHLFICLAIAGLAAVLVFAAWYPFPYRDLSGGRELFLLIILVDVVCGPLLTLVLFNSAKPRLELLRDLAFVVVIQLSALAYGLFTVWEARPLYLVMEIDRFKVISAPDLREAKLQDLPAEMQPRWIGAPVTVGIRPPKDAEERSKVLFESVDGGRDYAERPEFYVPYKGEAALRTLLRAKKLVEFLQKYPDQRKEAEDIASKKGLDVAEIQYLPVVGRQDWVALLDEQGQIIGYLKGDGF